MAVTDSRFDTSQWEQGAKAGPSKLRTLEEDAASQGSNDGQSDEEDVEDDLEGDSEGDLVDDMAGSDDGDDDDDGNNHVGPVVEPLTKEELAAFEKKQRKRGIVYISRIPPGMTPPKVRHLLSNFGEVERIYLQDGRKKQREAETGVKKRSTRRNTTFTEGWIEFSEKAVAKIVASTLNAQPIGFASGGRKANKNAKRWKDDVWTMKYLPGFKWHMLSEQMAHERAAHASRLRTELSQSKMEQADYLKKVERARVQRQKDERRRQREAKAATPGDDKSASAAAPSAAQRIRTFQQRKPVLRDVRDLDEDAAKAKTNGRQTVQNPLKRPSSSSGTDSNSKRSRGGGQSTGQGNAALQYALGKIL
ncbi:unnamed protein product [Parajaminaea phylloscopi]